MIDPFERYSDNPSAPAAHCFPITPHDEHSLKQATKAIYVGTGGDLAIEPLRGSQVVTFRNVPAGGLIDIRARAVRATGTTAADLVALA